MIYLYFLASCVVFIELFIALRIKREATQLISSSRDALKVVGDSQLDDDEKEAFMRRASVEMFKVTFFFLVKFLFIVLALYSIFWLTLFAAPELRAPILEGFVSPAVIAGLTLAAAAYSWVRNVLFR